MPSPWKSDVDAFLERFHQDARDTPGWPSPEICNLRRRLINEEYDELAQAWMIRDLPGTADAIIDLCYVLIGTLPALGIDADPIWDAIHEANMRKIGGGKDEHGKIMKPDGWSPPDVARLLRNQGWGG